MCPPVSFSAISQRRRDGTRLARTELLRIKGQNWKEILLKEIDRASVTPRVKGKFIRAGKNLRADQSRSNGRQSNYRPSSRKATLRTTRFEKSPRNNSSAPRPHNLVYVRKLLRGKLFAPSLPKALTKHWIPRAPFNIISSRTKFPPPNWGRRAYGVTGSARWWFKCISGRVHQLRLSIAVPRIRPREKFPSSRGANGNHVAALLANLE